MNGFNVPDPLSALESIPEWIHFRDLNGSIRWSNNASREVFGWTPDSAGAFQPDDDPLVARAMMIAERTGRWTGIIHRPDRNGNQRELESRWSLSCDKDGTQKGFLVFEIDMDGRRQLDENQIRAQRMESIGTLAGGVAHDINNVLGPILIGAEMVKRRIDDPWVRKKMEGMEASARRGAEIVKQVLDFSRGSDGEKIVVQIRHVLKELVDFARHTFSKSIRVEGDFPRDLPPILGDAAQLRQVVLNIMINARDAMPNGGALMLRASTTSLTAQEASAISPGGIEGEYVRINVIDNGPGIAPEVIDRIFEPFFSTKTRGKGTGLGLSTALSIVQGHSGFLGVSSHPGEGSTFSLFLPIAEIASSAFTEEQTGQEQGESQGATILIVDDEPMMLEMNTDMLESYGFTAWTAEDGQAALDLFLEDPSAIDLIVTDINMPKVDGPTLIREMRTRRPELPVVAVSGLSEIDHAREGTGLEGVQILIKPYSTDELLKAIKGRLKEPLESDDSDRDSGEDEVGSSNTLSDEAFDRFMDGEDW